MGEAERAAERRALESLKSAPLQQLESVESVVELERNLLAAETSVNDLLASKEQLEKKLVNLTDDQKRAEAERIDEAERVRRLEEKAMQAERKAELTAGTLTASEQRIAELQAELSELKGALEASNAQNVGSAREEAAEAVNLANDIESQLLASSDRAGLASLSGMKKKDLIAECVERKLESLAQCQNCVLDCELNA